MNFSLFKATFRANWVIAIIFFAIMFMYLSIILTMFDPDSMDSLNQMLETLPSELISAMGFDALITDLTSFLAGYYYGFLVIMFPMIYCIITANRLVAKHVDSGSMAYLLSTPHSRLTIVSTQASYLMASLADLLILIGLAALALSAAMYPGQLSIGPFLLLNLMAILLMLAISGICFFFSCIFDDTKYSLALGAGIPVLFFLIDMLAKVGGSTWLKNLTLFTLYNPAKIVAGDFSWISALVFLAVAIATYLGGILLFNRRSLPL